MAGFGFGLGHIAEFAPLAHQLEEALAVVVGFVLTYPSQCLVYIVDLLLDFLKHIVDFLVSLTHFI